MTALDVLLRVLGTEHVNDCVCVPVTHFVLGLQEGNLLPVGLASHVLKFVHPEIDWLAVLLFDRRKIRGWAFDFFIHAKNLLLFRHLASGGSAWQLVTICRNPFVDLRADWVYAWHNHDCTYKLQQHVRLDKEQLGHAVVTGEDFAVNNQLNFVGRLFFGQAKIGKLGPLVGLNLDRS